MKHSPFLLTCLMVSSCWAAEPSAQSLFDGKSLVGWEGNPQHWRVENGAITGEIPEGQTLNHNEFIYWKGEVHDFDLTVEYRITGGPGANSGIQFRSERLPDGAAAGYQADLDDGKLWLGRIYEELRRGLIVERGTRVSIAPDGRRWKDVFAEPDSFQKVAKANDWNTYHIRSTASHTELWINGVLFSVLDDHESGKAKFGGKIAFQLHSAKGPAKIEFRSVKLIDLGQTAAPKYDVKPVATKEPEVSGIEPKGKDGKSLNLGFETGTLDGWKAEGDAWVGQPIKGDTVVLRKRGSSKHAGDYWIGGYEKVGDKGTGRLTSSSFEVTQPWASFLIGGGKNAQQTRVEVVEESTGKIIHSAAGLDIENMRREAVNLRAYSGKRIFVRLIDEGKSGWGHLNFDDFLFHEKAPTIAAVQTASINPNDRAARLNESPVLWHLQSNPAKPTDVKNDEAQKLVAGMKLQPGFQAELIAAEPDVKQPVAFCFDERGRMWVAEAYSYPNRQPEGKGKDRIIILEDKDGDGKFETHKVFCEGLNLISGIEVGFGGVWVGAAPYLMFIPKDSDDKAGAPQILLDGFGYQDTHETLNSFLWGPDGWLYGNQGVFNTAQIGKPGCDPKDRITLRSGVWRYHPVRHVFEVFCHGGSNQWGLDYNSNGHLFMTHCRSFWGKGGTTNAIRNGIFWNQSNANYPSYVSATAPDFAPNLQNYLPASAKYDSGEGGAGKPGTTAVYGGHSHVGTMIYNGDNWPAIYRDHLFTHNLHGHQMNQQHMVREGSGYETLHAGYDMLFCGDEHYIPVDLQTGPDGAVYVIDWCDTQHCHNPEDEKWDRTNGRIYRISWKETYKPVKVPAWDQSIYDVTIIDHQSSNVDRDWYRRMRRRLLQEGSIKLDEHRYGLPEVRYWRSAFEPKNAPVADKLWLLWSASSVFRRAPEKLPEAYEQAAQEPNDIVRSWAIQLATEERGKPMLSKALLLKLAKEDASPTVRLALASAMPMLDADTALEIGSALAMHGEDKDDRFLPKMIWFGLAGSTSNMPVLLDLANRTPMPSLADSIRWYACKDASSREAFLSSIAKQPNEVATRSLKLLAFALKDEAKVPMPKAWTEVSHRFATLEEATRLSALFGDTTVLAQMRETLEDAKQPIAKRRAAFELLRRVGDAQAKPVFSRLLDDPDFASAVIPALAGSNDPFIGGALIQRFEKLNAQDRQAALNVLTAQPNLAHTLLLAVKANTFDKQRLSALQIRQMRNLHDTKVDQLLDATWGKVNESSEATKATIAKLKQAYASAPLWAFNGKSGEETFKQVCAVCHAMNGVGGKLGPDLAGSWRNGVDYFLENIVDPNAVVGEQYQLNIITKKDGTILSGIIEHESDSAVTLRTITEAVIISKSEIKSRQKLAQSLMPPGMLEALAERKVIELLKYLTSKS